MDQKDIESLLTATTFCKAQLMPKLVNTEAARALKTDHRYLETESAILKRAKYFLSTKESELTYSLYSLFEKTKNRSEYEKVYFERRERLNVFAFLCIFCPCNQYLLALQDSIFSICNEYTWALPACMSINSMDFTKNSCTQQKEVELFACETAGALAEICYLLEDQLDAFLVFTVRQEINRRVLNPYLHMQTNFRWEKAPSNWTAVCAGSIGIAAIYTSENTQVLSSILTSVISNMRLYLSGFSKDGACVEGLAYWNYGTTYYISFAQLLFERTAGTINLLTDDFKEIAKFAGRCKLFGNQAVNFSDCAPLFTYREGFLHKLKDIFSDIEVPSSAYAMKYGEDHCHRWCGFIRDILWRKNKYRHDRDIEFSNHFFSDVEWYISKQSCENVAVSFAVKGGHNGEPHNHNDLGHFIYQINEFSFFIDLGAGKYDKDYFGVNRYNNMYTSSQGHSVPIINNGYQMHGLNYTTTNFSVTQAAKEQMVSMDLSLAYKDVAGFERKFVLMPNGVLTINDTFSNCKVVEQFVVLSLKNPVCNEGEIMLASNNVNAVLCYETSMVHEIKIIKAENEYAIGNIPVYIIQFSLSQNCFHSKFEIRPVLCKDLGS